MIPVLILGADDNLFFFSFFKTKLIGVQPINKVVIASGGQQRDSARDAHVSFLPQIPLPPGFHITSSSSPCYTVGLHWLSILNIAVCTCPSQTA